MDYRANTIAPTETADDYARRNAEAPSTIVIGRPVPIARLDAVRRYLNRTR